MVKAKGRRLQLFTVTAAIGMVMTGLCAPHQSEKAEAATPALPKVEMLGSFSCEDKTDQAEEWMISQFQQIAESSAH
jgi:hypothetical protein